MKRKLVKRDRSITVNIPPVYLELIGANAGDEVDILYNTITCRIEISKTQKERILAREG